MKVKMKRKRIADSPARGKGQVPLDSEGTSLGNSKEKQLEVAGMQCKNVVHPPNDFAGGGWKRSAQRTLPPPQETTRKIWQNWE